MNNDEFREFMKPTMLISMGKLKRQKVGLMQDLLTGKVRVKVDEFKEAATNG